MTAALAFLTVAPLWPSVSFFMIVSGLNFALHYHVWHSRNLKAYWSDPEARMYIYLLLIGMVITCLYLYYSGTYGKEESLTQGVFQLVSIMTTTGFATAEFSSLANIPAILFTVSVVFWCLCRLHWWRYQDWPHADSCAAGHKRNISPGAPQCAAADQDSQSQNSRAGGRCHLGFCWCLSGDFLSDGIVAAGIGA